MWQSRLRKISETTTEQKLLIEQILEANKVLVKENKKLERSVENMKEFIEESL